MPMDFMLTTDILNDCFTVSQVSDVFNSKDSIAANQLIIKYLTANLSNTKDLLELCTRLQKISTSPKLDRVISDLEKSCKFVVITKFSVCVCVCVRACKHIRLLSKVAAIKGQDS